MAIAHDESKKSTISLSDVEALMTIFEDSSELSLGWVASIADDVAEALGKKAQFHSKL